MSLSKIVSITVLSLAFCFTLTLSADAAVSDELQPASTVEGPASIGGVGQFDSLKVGSQGTGGVTYFNGTIVNETTNDSGGGIPITMGDDLRIDGVVWRGPSKGTSDSKALRIADALHPAMDDINDIGSGDYRWQDLYLSGTATMETLSVHGDGEVRGTLTIEALSGEVITGENIEAGTITGEDLDTSADFTIGGLTTSGDIVQDPDGFGAAKALVQVNGNASCAILQSWTYDGSSVSCVQGGGGAGHYIVTFDSSFDLNNHFIIGTTEIQDTTITASAAPPSVIIYLYDAANTARTAGTFTIAIF